MALKVGDKAPEFELTTKTADGPKLLKLSDNFGKQNTLLLFVPMAFTGVCTKELCDVSQGLNAFTSLNSAVWGISGDNPFAQEAWAQKEKIGIKLASDLNKKTAEAYGTLLSDLIGLGAVSARAAFVVDKAGVIQYSEQTPTPKDLPNFEAIKATLAKLG